VNQARPAAVLAYCIIAGAFLIIGAAIGASSLRSPAAVAPTLTDVMLAYFPLVLAATGVVGMWFMRWWAVALFWLLIMVMVAVVMFVPFPGSSDDFLQSAAINVAIWIALIALPPTVIAFSYRRRFR